MNYPWQRQETKWEVRELDFGGKPSMTKRKVCKDAESTKEGIVLELHPITDRTHQLRIHCQEIGSGIVGDSLYGDSPVPWDAGKPAVLRLHATNFITSTPS